jgi:phosphoribosylaminoimidazole carboxylase PurE protein
MADAKVAVLMGSESDRTRMEGTLKVLEDLGIPHEAHVMSAHRSPDRVAAFAAGAAGKGLRVLIAGAGMANHLAGAVAARTLLPVIGVPLDASPLSGMDSLLSTVQMPPGVPVATVAVGSAGAKNAAWLAAEILALGDPDLAGRLRARREAMGG